MGNETMNAEIRNALVKCGFEKKDENRYEFSQEDKKMVWTGVRDYYFAPCTRTYVVSFEKWWGEETATTRIFEDGKEDKMIRFQPCPWGWKETDSQVWQMRTELRNEGCKIK